MKVKIKDRNKIQNNNENSSSKLGEEVDVNVILRNNRIHMRAGIVMVQNIRCN